MAQDDHGTIGNFLRAPGENLTLQAFITRFRARRITFTLPGLAQAAGDPALGGRIRGAFGEQLLRTASPEAVEGRPCPWEPPCAFEALFRKQGRMTGGTDFPDSCVIAAIPRREALDVSLTMFGCATEWAPAAAEILAETLLYHVRWFTKGARSAPPVTIATRRMRPVSPPALDGAAEEWTLDFLTPLASSSPMPDAGAALGGALKGLGLRLEGLARWHGLSLAAEDWPARMAALEALSITWSEHEALRWRRGSRRQNVWVPMGGHLGRAHLSGPATAMAALAPLLRLGAITHLGADIVFGCGKFRLD